MSASVYKSLPILILIIMKAVTVSGQVSGVHGRILEGDSRWPVYKVLVQNISTHRWTTSDTAGCFHLQAAAGDTFVFSANGYYHLVKTVTDSMLNTTVYRSFEMNPLVYPIREANVFALGTYKEFKQKFISLDLSKDKTAILRRELQQESVTAAREAYRNMQDKQKIGGGVGVPILTPQEKERIKLGAILAAEIQRKQVYTKYNPVIIKKITGIATDEEMLEFMAFCNFSDEWIMNTNEYDLVEMIVLKYKEFRRAKKGMGSDRKVGIPADRTLPFETC